MRCKIHHGLFRKILLTVILVLILVSLGSAWAWRRSRLFTLQIHNLELFKSYMGKLEDYRASNEHYPYRLAAVADEAALWGHAPGQDAWGYPLRYESDGVGFVLVSYGRGGRPEYRDYWAIRAEQSTPPTNMCLEWSRDQVASDVGWHQYCGK